MFYYLIICYYLKLKQREVNNYLKKITENKHKFRVFNSNQMIAKLTQIYGEIKEYDSSYWSKFLAITWICFSGLLSTIIFLFLFQEANVIIKYLLGYAVVVIVSLLLIIIHMTASVNYE